MQRTAIFALLTALLASAAFAGPAQGKSECPTDPTARGAAGIQGDVPVGQEKSATLLFIPGPVRTPQPDLAAYLEQLPGFSVGLFSPTLGRYSPAQMMLDISQGARVASSLYSPVTPAPPGLVLQDVGGALEPWEPFVKRADNVPGDIVPGLLGCAMSQANKSVAWYGYAGSPTITSIAAATAAGLIPSVGDAATAKYQQALIGAQKRNDLLVASLPPGGEGLGIARGLSEQNPDRLYLIVQAPPEPARTRLLTFAAFGIGGGENGLKSATTRRDGLVAATDFAPTILERIGVERPAAMQGQPIEAGRKLSAEQLGEMNDRLALIAGRRAPLGRSVIVLGGIVVALLLLLGRLTGRYDEISRLTQRVVGLAVLWLPLMLLITAALRPSRATEADIAIAGSLLLGFATDRFVRWPRALFIPVFFVVIAHGLDFLLLGGQLTGESLLGSNPLYGARFFGVGNELEAVIAVSAVMGVGAGLSDSGARHPARWFAGAGVALALYLGAGRLGADVGGVIYIGAAFGIAALYVARSRLTPLRVAALLALPILGLLAIGALDAVTGGESHLTRTIFEAQGFGDLLKVADRRFSASIEGAKSDSIWAIVIAAFALLLWGWFKRERLFAPLTRDGEDPAGRRPFRAGMVGALGGTVVGALANDSGPAILIIGTIYICMGLLYLRGRPVSGTIEE